MTESARAEAFASQADRSRAQAEGYVRQSMDVARRIRDLSNLISQQLSRHSIPHQWVGTELQLLSPETGEWLAGPNLRGPQGLGISGMEAGEDGRLTVSLENGDTFDAGPLPIGPSGSSAFVYIAYASDDDGADFTAEFDPELEFVAILTTGAAIVPSADDFAGLWVRYRGRDGVDGADGQDGADGADGGNGWTPKLAAVSDGERRVFQVADWLGGSGTKPETGEYLGASGWVETAAEALDVRGPAGAAGAGTGDMLASVYDPEGRAADAFNVDNHVDGSSNKVFTNLEKTKLGRISVTQAVDLDAIEARMVALDAAVILKGSWSAAGGSFPGSGSAQAGESWIVSTGGTVGGVAFNANDRIIAITDNASASTFAGNWFKADYTDQVLSVDGTTGTVTVGAIIAAATAKTTPVDADALGISDSAASNATKKVTFASLASWVWSKLGGLINGGTAKTAPADADLLVLADSAASNAAKKLTWANVKAALKTYFDTLYQAKGTWTQIGTTQTASGKDTVTFSGLSGYSEFYVEVDGIVIGGGSAVEPNGFVLTLGTSVDDGSSYQNDEIEDGWPVIQWLAADDEGGVENFLGALSPRTPATYLVDFPSSRLGFASILPSGGRLTNLRVRSGCYDDALGDYVFSNMTAGTIKLFGR